MTLAWQWEVVWTVWICFPWMQKVIWHANPLATILPGLWCCIGNAGIQWLIMNQLCHIPSLLDSAGQSQARPQLQTWRVAWQSHPCWTFLRGITPVLSSSAGGGGSSFVKIAVWSSSWSCRRYAWNLLANYACSLCVQDAQGLHSLTSVLLQISLKIHDVQAFLHTCTTDQVYTAPLADLDCTCKCNHSCSFCIRNLGWGASAIHMQGCHKRFWLITQQPAIGQS